MASAHLLRLQIEAALADRIPSALTPAPRLIRPTAPTGIPTLDDCLGGGLPIGAITELTGPECSGRTSLALSFIAGLTQAGRVCAWVDVSDTLHPESAAAIGVDLSRLLWVRCGAEPQPRALPGMDREKPQQNRASQHEAKQPPAAPKNISTATKRNPPVSTEPRCAEPVPKVRRQSREVVSSPPAVGHRAPHVPSSVLCAPSSVRKPWPRLDQALRATDLLLQAGGFSAIVLDMGSIPPEFALRIPLATWFRYRAAAERTHASVVLLTQHNCTKSSAGLVLRCLPGQVSSETTTVLTSAEHRVEIARERFAPSTKGAGFARKPPQSDHSIHWNSHTPWASAQPLCAGSPERKKGPGRL